MNYRSARTTALGLIFFATFAAAGGLVCYELGGGWPPPAAANGDPAVATDHADRTTQPDDVDDRDLKPDNAPPRSTWSRFLGLLTKASWVALGGAAMALAAQGLAALRRRKKRLRKGLLGYVAGAIVTGLFSFGVAAALSGSLDAGAAALAGSVVTAVGLSRDPETGKVPVQDVSAAGPA